MLPYIVLAWVGAAIGIAIVWWRFRSQVRRSEEKLVERWIDEHPAADADAIRREFQ